MPRLIALGETMVSFSAESRGYLRYARQYRPYIAGAETNTLIGISKLGISGGWISKLGDDEFGKFVLNAVRGEGVDCSTVKMDKTHPTGIMFKERRFSESKVFYYREGSAASALRPEDIDEEYLRQGETFYFSGVTPVLSETCQETVRYCVALAQKYHLKIGYDPNVRKKLWKTGKEKDILREFLLCADYVFLGTEELRLLMDTTDTQKAAELILQHNPDAIVVIKQGSQGACVVTAEQQFKSDSYPCVAREPIGAGDAFNAGFLGGLLQGKSLDICAKMANIAGALVTETESDTENQPDAQEILNHLNGLSEVFR